MLPDLSPSGVPGSHVPRTLCPPPNPPGCPWLPRAPHPLPPPPLPLPPGVPGFQVHRTRADHRGQWQFPIDEELRDKVFYWDVIHPDGRTGHKAMGELVAQYLLDGLADVKARPLVPAELLLVSEPLLPPLLDHNFESVSDKCFIGNKLVEIVVDKGGWDWKNEGKSVTNPKWGYIADTPGKTLSIKINTTAATGHRERLVGWGRGRHAWAGGGARWAGHLGAHGGGGRGRGACVLGCGTACATILALSWRDVAWCEMTRRDVAWRDVVRRDVLMWHAVVWHAVALTDQGGEGGGAY